jgi:hypothetical protein
LQENYKKDIDLSHTDNVSNNSNSINEDETNDDLVSSLLN